MSECGRHSRAELAFLDALDAGFLRWRATLTLHFLCSTCGREVVESPGEHSEPYPVCCQWEMVELPPLDFSGPALRVVG